MTGKTLTLEKISHSLQTVLQHPRNLFLDSNFEITKDEKDKISSDTIQSILDKTLLEASHEKQSETLYYDLLRLKGLTHLLDLSFEFLEDPHLNEVKKKGFFYETYQKIRNFIKSHFSTFENKPLQTAFENLKKSEILINQSSDPLMHSLCCQKIQNILYLLDLQKKIFEETKSIVSLPLLTNTQLSYIKAKHHLALHDGFFLSQDENSFTSNFSFEKLLEEYLKTDDGILAFFRLKTICNLKIDEKGYIKFDYNISLEKLKEMMEFFRKEKLTPNPYIQKFADSILDICYFEYYGKLYLESEVKHQKILQMSLPLFKISPDGTICGNESLLKYSREFNLLLHRFSESEVHVFQELFQNTKAEIKDFIDLDIHFQLETLRQIYHQEKQNYQNIYTYCYQALEKFDKSYLENPLTHEYFISPKKFRNEKDLSPKEIKKQKRAFLRERKKEKISQTDKIPEITQPKIKKPEVFIQYSQRVIDWFECPEKILFRQEYRFKTSAQKQSAIRNHTFGLVLDSYIQKFGIKTDWLNKTTNHKDLHYSIPGEIILEDGTVDSGIFTYCFGIDKKCYHRAFVRLSHHDLVREFINNGNWTQAILEYSDLQEASTSVEKKGKEARDESYVIKNPNPFLKEIWDPKNRIKIRIFNHLAYSNSLQINE